MTNPSPTAKAIVLAALGKQPHAERAAYLDQACGTNGPLRAEVEALLADQDRAARSWPSPEGHTPPVTAEEGVCLDRAARRIGPYKLLQVIGEGGMGVVYLAEQTHPVGREVALKVIRSGLDSRQVVARFEAERQALALMDHPNIAKVLDGGTTDSGRSYFVMELVRGVPITRYCDEHRLTPRQRLELFVPVCQAVQHAHQKGVIHRDLKPSNVLVTRYDGRPVPKVIDFGVAKATGPKLTDRTLFTEFGAIVGTLEYMSPEQAELSALDVDTRSDIFTLGVLLYELLTGTTPLERKRIKAAAMFEALRLVREEEPPRPSARLSTTEELPSIAARRSMEPRKLSGLLRGELDWIVMKALEKDRNRRYETANGLARDLERYLADEPVQACPPSTGYRLRKFTRRNRAPVLAACLVALALVGGIIGTTWQAVRASRAERAAVAERDEKDRALQAEQQARHEAAQAGRQTLEALRALTDDVVERQMARQVRLTDQDRAFLRRILAFYEGFAATKEGSSEGRHIRVEGLIRVGVLRDRLGELKEAQAAFEQARDLGRQLVAEHPADRAYRKSLAVSQHRLGMLLAGLGRQAEAETEYRDTLALYQQLIADFPDVPEYRQDLGRLRNSLGHMLRDSGKPAEAEVEHRRAVALFLQLADEFPTAPEYRHDLARSRNLLGISLRWQRKLVEAEAENRLALAVIMKLTAEFPGVPEYRQDLARFHSSQGGLLEGMAERSAEAAAEYRAALAVSKELEAAFPTVPEYRLDLADTRRSLGEVLSQAGRRAEAEDECRAALALFVQLTADFPLVPRYRSEVGGSHISLGSVFQDAERWSEAEAEFRAANSIFRQLLTNDPNNPSYRASLGYCTRLLGEALCEWGRPAEALPWLDDAVQQLSHATTQSPQVPGYRTNLGYCYRFRAMALARVRRFEQAVSDCDRALEWSDEVDRPSLRLLRTLYVAGIRPAAAVAEAEACLKTDRSGPSSSYMAACVFALASTQTREQAEKECYAARAVALLRLARAQGCFEMKSWVQRLEKNVWLEALRQRADFRELTRDLRAPFAFKQ